MSDIDVFAPNLSRRISGVSATVMTLVPLQARKLKIATTGNRMPADLPYFPLWRIPFLPRKTRVWHARRNNEMLVGVILKYVFRSKLKLIFTSSSPRKRGALTRFLASRMDAIVATNTVNASVMPGDPIVIPHGVDVQKFTPDDSDLFDAAGQKLIGCFGRIRALKGIDVFVTAMCDLLPRYPDHAAVILGRVTSDNAEFAQTLKAQISAAGLENRIRFVEEFPLDQMPAAYRALSLYVCPSLLEGFGLTPLEAMACGVPVVASRDVGTFNDQIVEGETGYLAEKGNASEFSQHIEKIIENPKLAESLSLKARQHVVETFALEQEADALVDLYQQLLGHPHDA